jgi:hypothetical protein
MPTLTTKASPVFNPADFVLGIDNPYMTLQPGATYVYKNDGTGETVLTETTRDTIVLDGVVCTVVHDRSFEDGELTEDTLDYFAQDKSGNVWYFGEDTKELEDGKVVSTEGTWHAGVDGATPGIVMEANPQAGDQYQQEHATGVAEDMAKVITLSALVDSPYASSGNALETDEFTPLEPGLLEHKFYIAGVGLVETTDANDPESIEELIKIIFDGTSKADSITGNIGPDEINGFAGNDHLNGGTGNDIVKGGRGDDVISGGLDKDVDILYGNQGLDRISLGTGDKGYGGDGNDRIRLLDNDGFGLVDGGKQNGSNLGATRGDILQFEGNLDLTKAGVSERITHIETLSMVGAGHDHLTLSASDVLGAGDGQLNPAFCGKDKWGKGDAVRVDGGDGDQLTLAGGKWHEVEDVKNVPDNYDVFARQTAHGTAYVVVNEDVQVHLT